MDITAVPKSERLEKIRSQLNKDVHPHLPKLPFVMGLVASKGSGKSTIIYNLMHKPTMYYQKFDQVWVFSPTIHLDDTYRLAKFKPERLISDVTKFEETFLEIMKEIDKKIEAITLSCSRKFAGVY